MKLLQNMTFESLSSSLSVSGESINIQASIESYSCKMTTNDKRLYKELNMHGHSPKDLEALAPSESQVQKNSVSPQSTFQSRSRLSSTEEDSSNIVLVMNRKMLFTLISTLNASFPDYEFSHVKSEEFSREPDLPWVINNVNSLLSTAMGEEFAILSTDMWKAINDEINLQNCQIYSYHPDMETDPFGEEGSVWSFNYFFFNKQIKRIVFFKCTGLRLSADASDYIDDNCNLFQMDVCNEIENTGIKFLS
ncbi:repressor of RNA polymerase III transcription MAF1 homolog isoform X2 [Hydra vulgaris]|uniref:Repressor of RNA polymerase III transcription MAF1 n=1 Tax=Hydra vulgaris TaxID=6087 RepID=A0ABM4DK25_HYDVU